MEERLILVEEKKEMRKEMREMKGQSEGKDVWLGE